MSDVINTNPSVATVTTPSASAPTAPPAPPPAAPAPPPAAPQSVAPPVTLPPPAPPAVPAAPTSQAVVSEAGAVAASPTTAPLPLQPGQPVRYVDPQTGQVREIPAAELIRAHDEVQRVRAAGYDLFLRGINGDTAAANQYLDMLSRRTQSAPASQQQQPAANDDGTIRVPKEEWDEIRARHQREQANEVQNAVRNMLQRPEFGALARRPGAVREVIDRLVETHRQGIQLTPQTVNSIMTQMNAQEQQYQEQLLAPYRSRTGDPGAADPFRDGDAQLIAQERPHPIRDEAAWKKYLGARFRHTLREAEMRSRQIFGS